MIKDKLLIYYRTFLVKSGAVPYNINIFAVKHSGYVHSVGQVLLPNEFFIFWISDLQIKDCELAAIKDYWCRAKYKAIAKHF